MENNKKLTNNTENLQTNTDQESANELSLSGSSSNIINNTSNYELGESHRIGSYVEFNNPDELYDRLIQTVNSYHPSADFSMIEKAYHLSKEAHAGQFRKSGEPFIIHPLWVAIILAKIELDKESIIAGILHDVVEDTHYSLEEIAEMFSPEIALLVDGVTKLSNINYSQDKVEAQAENLRKMFIAMAKDIRVILIKLADRLHNMRTMEYQTPEKQTEKARETIEIYAPIAQRLGISKIKVELDDLSLKYLEPDTYHSLAKKISLKKDKRREIVDHIVDEVQLHLDEAEVEAKVVGRIKHFFSIYKKMVTQDKTLEQIYDLFAVRILVNTVKDCYAALGVIHEMYKPIPGRFKDYIAMPKPNMYQSLHTSLIGPTGERFEIQIRTFDMHRTAEYGIAAHWKYKEAIDGKTAEDAEEEKLAWLREILEWQRDMSDNREFLSLLKNDLDLFSDNVYCFTPRGDVKTLPAGSTPIDFAYNIHSAVGNKMVGARVNGNLVNIDYEIKNGDQIDIITSKNSNGPSRDWLKLVKSTQAKNKINQWFKSQLKEDNILKGKEQVSSYAKSKSIVLSDLLKPQYMDKVLNKYGYRDWKSLYAAVGHGSLKESQIVDRLVVEYEKQLKKEMTDEKVLETISDIKSRKQPAKLASSKSGILVEGVNDLAVRFSKCCNPVPGDEIVGFVTRGRGISIHRTDCVNIINISQEDRARMIDAQWSESVAMEDSSKLYNAEIKIYAHDKSGVLLEISKIFTEEDINVDSMTVRTSKQETATITVGFEINNTEQLSDIVTKLRKVESIIDIERTTG